MPLSVAPPHHRLSTGSAWARVDCRPTFPFAYNEIVSRDCHSETGAEEEILQPGGTDAPCHHNHCNPMMSEEKLQTGSVGRRGSWRLARCPMSDMSLLFDSLLPAAKECNL